ncbi:MAG: metalloprotease TldD [Myxococcales bacterium]|nr:metalloprotease TldD [Myxococcales bacterium]
MITRHDTAAPPLGSHFESISAPLARKLLELALSSGGDYADLFFEYRAGADFTYEDQRVKSVGRGITCGLGVRVLKGDATGYAYCEQFEPEAMKRAARTAAQIAAAGSTLPPEQVVPVAIPDFYPVATPTASVLAPEKLALLRRGDLAARAADPRITKVVCTFAEEQKEILIVTADGRLFHDTQPLMRYGVYAIAESSDNSGKRQTGSSGGGGRKGMDYFDDRSPEWHGAEAARIALAMLDAVDAPAGEMEVVLGPGDSGILLHEAIGHGLEADFNRKNTSNYSGRIGGRVASELCTVVDDGTVGHSRGAINVDDEGNPGRSNTLIENGILVGYMHDWLSAKHYKIPPSGNGRRQSFRHNPMPRMTNTLLVAGPHDPEEILRSVKRGVYAKRFSGGQVNISNGDFVFSLTESYLIEDGRLTAPLKGVNLIGNGPDVLTKVTMLGSDFQYSDGIWTCGKDGQSVPVGVGTPTVKIAAITVGGTRA